MIISWGNGSFFSSFDDINHSRSYLKIKTPFPSMGIPIIKTVVIPPYIYNGNPSIGKWTSLYWDNIHGPCSSDMD